MYSIAQPIDHDCNQMSPSISGENNAIRGGVNRLNESELDNAMERQHNQK